MKNISREKAGIPGKVSWESPSNIALVKYWGKRNNQLPMNPSLSFSLRDSRTITSVEYRPENSGGFRFEFFFAGQKKPAFEPKVRHFLEMFRNKMPFPENILLRIESRNTFPHSAGIASSASAMSSLALALLDVQYKLSGKKPEDKELFRKASEFARLGSGSASRSVYGNYVLWGEFSGIENSSDHYALPLDLPVYPVFQKLNDSILVVDATPKNISSSRGHSLMTRHPYARARYEQARKNLQLLLKALQAGDVHSFISIVENEALSLHSLMLSSEEGYFLLKSGTLEILEKIRDFRNRTGTFLTFTLDAGPNVHLIYPDTEQTKVRSFIDSELRRFCHRGMIIHDTMGEGPLKLN